MRLERIEPGEQPRLHVGHARAVGVAVVDAERPLRGGPRVEHGVHVPDQQDPRAVRPCRGTSRPPCCRIARRIGPDVDLGPELGQEARGPAADLVDAVGRIRPAVDVDELLEVREVGREIRRDRGAKGVDLEVRRRRPGSSSRPVYAGVRVAILPGPCDWSRSACSRDRTSTGSSRWSRWRSRSVDAGRGTASAIPAATPWSGSAPRCRLASGPIRSPRSWPGSAGCAWTTARVDAGLAVHRSSDPGHWIITFPWSGEERARDPDRGGHGSRRSRRLAVADRPADRRAGAALTRWTERIAGGPDVAAGLDPRHRAARPDRFDLGDQRQVHGHPADHPHPGPRPGDTSARPPRTASSSTSGWSRPATGRGRPARSRCWPGRESTSPCSRPPEAGSCCAAWATSRTTRPS